MGFWRSRREREKEGVGRGGKEEEREDSRVLDISDGHWASIRRTGSR